MSVTRNRFQGLRRLVVAAPALLLLLGSCGPDMPAPSQDRPAFTPSGSASPRPTHAPRQIEERTPIALPDLPGQGIAVSAPNSVVLLDLSGREIVRINGFEIWNSDARASAIALRGRGGVWILRPRAHLLRPVGDRRVAFPDPRRLGRLGLRRPIGSRYEGTVVGHWRYALPSPDGSWLLAQWSGECEVPTAFFASPRGGRPVAVTGEPGLEGAPESFGLGWTDDGRAVVILPVGACGGTFETPGLYLFDGPGAGVLFHAIPRNGRAAMWGSA